MLSCVGVSGEERVTTFQTAVVCLGDRWLLDAHDQPTRRVSPELDRASVWRAVLQGYEATPGPARPSRSRVAGRPSLSIRRCSRRGHRPDRTQAHGLVRPYASGEFGDDGLGGCRKRRSSPPNRSDATASRSSRSVDRSTRPFGLGIRAGQAQVHGTHCGARQRQRLRRVDRVTLAGGPPRRVRSQRSDESAADNGTERSRR